MKKLRENSVWCYTSEDRKWEGNECTIFYHHFICNYGSKANFLKLIQSVYHCSTSWVKDRITESGNVEQLKLSAKYPESFIHYTTKGHWDDFGFDIKHLIEKNPK